MLQRFRPRNAMRFIAALAIWGGCGSQVDDNVVARVADKEITAEALLQFRADTPALLRSEKEGVEALNDYLQTLIDIELMLLEARELQLQRDPDFVRRWEEERKRKLIFEFQLRRIMHQVDVPPKEMMERFIKSKWSHMVRLARIRVNSLQEAEKVVWELEKGIGFSELAMERSVDRETAPQGGRLDYFLGRNELEERGFSVELAEELFELEVGAFSRPYRKGDFYEIFQVLNQRPAPPGYAAIFSRTRMVQAFYTRRRALLDSLSRESNVRFDPEGIAIAVARLSTEEPPQLSAREEETLLCHYSDGRITVKDLRDLFYQDGVSQPSRMDSSTVAKSIRDHFLTEALFYREALQQGIAQDSVVAAWLATKEQEMLIQAVKERTVDQWIDLSEEAVRRYYEENLDRFTREAEVRIVEILVRTREEAEELRQRIGRGESMEELAARHSIRKGAQNNRGRLHMHPKKRGLYGALHTVVMQAEAGRLHGPTKIDSTRTAPGGYSLFEVVEKNPHAIQPFAQAESRVRYWLRQEQEAEIIPAMFQELREKYAAKIDIFTGHLKAAASGS